MTVSGRQPKQWDQIFQHLQQEIEAGWPADTAFWSAEDLHERFQISIGMANRILQELELGGWLYAVQGIRERRVVGKRHVSDRSTEFLRDPAWKRPWIKTIDAAIEDQPPDWVQAIRGPGPAWRWKSYQGDGIVTLAIADGWYDVDSPAVLLEKKPDRPFYRLLERLSQASWNFASASFLVIYPICSVFCSGVLEHVAFKAVCNTGISR